MSDKRTYCPDCLTTYKVSVAQLTIAQGMVCCPKCTTSFNALSHLVTEPKHSVTQMESNLQAEPLTPIQDQDLETPHSTIRTSADINILLNIFNQKVENSNIDLKTYLNNLNYFSTEPISILPAVNWEAQQEQHIKHGWSYYLGWSVLSLCLIGTLSFQFFWFNPQYLKNSHIMGTAFNRICDVFNCSNLTEHYDLINTRKLKVSSVTPNKTQFSGELINYHERSLAMPKLRIDLKKENITTASYTLMPNEYLTESLRRIERIPQNSPFKFQFELPVKRDSFNTYSLEIIRP